MLMFLFQLLLQLTLAIVSLAIRLALALAWLAGRVLVAILAASGRAIGGGLAGAVRRWWQNRKIKVPLRASDPRPAPRRPQAPERGGGFIPRRLRPGRGREEKW